MQEWNIFKGRSTTKVTDRDEKSYPSIPKSHYESYLPCDIVHDYVALIKVIGIKMKKIIKLSSLESLLYHSSFWFAILLYSINKLFLVWYNNTFKEIKNVLLIICDSRQGNGRPVVANVFICFNSKLFILYSKNIGHIVWLSNFFIFESIDFVL